MIVKLGEDGSVIDRKKSEVVSRVRYGDHVIFISNSGLGYVFNTKTNQIGKHSE